MRRGLYPRYAEARLLEALADTPAVLIHGPRQCGKTTLAQKVGRAHGYAYFSFDDPNVLGSAKADPAGFAAGLPQRAVLDEVQRVPELFSALKLSIDRDRRPGRIILTGSANVLLVPRLSDSLAGRMEVLRLHPLSQGELAGRSPGFLDALFTGRFGLARRARLGKELAERVASGGYPAALARASGQRRREWYRSYAGLLIERDVRQLARVSDLGTMATLLELAAGQTARLANVSELAGPFQLSRVTIRDYVGLLERMFVLEFVPPWHSNRLSRLVKAPKLHLGDSGLAAALLGMDAAALGEDRMLFGQLLETFVYGELRRQASWREGRIGFHHFRDRDGNEVDIVMQRDDGKIAGIEIKAAGTVGEKDLRGLKRLEAAAGKLFAAGVVLYDGENTLPLGPRLYAVPVRALWEMP
jgi:predicted AAA+ superfamily ATPase